MEGNTQLFIATIKPHFPVTSSTIARWFRKVISDQGLILAFLKPIRSEVHAPLSHLTLEQLKKIF